MANNFKQAQNVVQMLLYTVYIYYILPKLRKHALPVLVGEKSLLVRPNMLRNWRIHEPSRNKKITGKLNVFRLALHFRIARAFNSTGAYE